MAIPKPYVDELLARLDIITVIDSRVKLRKMGKNHSACCPFHEEKSPSFTVNEAKQFYYCFGCGTSGDAIGFVEKYEGLGFREAVEKLAASVGLPKHTDQQTRRSTIKPERRRELLRILENEKYLLNFVKASIQSGTQPTEEDKQRARVAAATIKKINEILAQ